MKLKMKLKKSKRKEKENEHPRAIPEAFETEYQRRESQRAQKAASSERNCAAAPLSWEKPKEATQSKEPRSVQTRPRSIRFPLSLSRLRRGVLLPVLAAILILRRLS